MTGILLLGAAPVATTLPQQGNLVTKFSADSLALSNGANVTSWTDSQNSIVAGTVVGTAPTFQTNQFNGKPSVRFGGAGNLSIATPGALRTAVDSQTYTVLIVAKTITGGGSNGFNAVFAASAGSNSFFYYSDTANLGRYNGVNNYSAISSGTSFFTMGSISGGALSLSLNSELQMMNGTSYYANNFLAPGSGGNTFGIGAWANGTLPWNGDLFEILVWNIALTPAEYMQAEKWARDKYGQVYPWAGQSKIPVFFGDSITAGTQASHLVNLPTYLAAQTLSLTYGQYQALGIPGLTMDQMTTLAPTYINPIAITTGKQIGVVCWEWANQRDFTTTKGALMLAALKAGTNVKTVFGTSTSATAYDNSADRASYNSAWDAIWSGAKTNLDAYMPIHTDTHIGVDGSYATFTTPTAGSDGLHLTDTTYPYLAALYAAGFASLP